MRPDSGSTGANTPKISTSTSAQMKSGHREKEPVHGVDRRGDAGQSLISDGEDGDGAAETDGDDERRDREFERRRQPLGEQFEHVAMQRDRGAEIAAEQLVRPDENCAGEARIEAVMGAQRRDVGRRGAGRDHHRDRIAGHDAQAARKR